MSVLAHPPARSPACLLLRTVRRPQSAVQACRYRQILHCYWHISRLPHYLHRSSPSKYWFSWDYRCPSYLQCLLPAPPKACCSLSAPRRCRMPAPQTLSLNPLPRHCTHGQAHGSCLYPLRQKSAGHRSLLHLLIHGASTRLSPCMSLHQESYSYWSHHRQ